jgi:hypothetical protein
MDTLTNGLLDAAAAQDFARSGEARLAALAGDTAAGGHPLRETCTARAMIALVLARQCG